MTLCGKTATRTGSSRWISGAESREIVHALRGRMDALIVGAETARRDDPLLTARPAGTANAASRGARHPGQPIVAKPIGLHRAGRARAGGGWRRSS